MFYNIYDIASTLFGVSPWPYHDSVVLEERKTSNFSLNKYIDAVAVRMETHQGEGDNGEF